MSNVSGLLNILNTLVPNNDKVEVDLENFKGKKNEYLPSYAISYMYSLFHGSYSILYAEHPNTLLSVWQELNKFSKTVDRMNDYEKLQELKKITQGDHTIDSVFEHKSVSADEDDNAELLRLVGSILIVYRSIKNLTREPIATDGHIKSAKNRIAEVEERKTQEFVENIFPDKLLNVYKEYLISSVLRPKDILPNKRQISKIEEDNWECMTSLAGDIVFANSHNIMCYLGTLTCNIPLHGNLVCKSYGIYFKNGKTNGIVDVGYSEDDSAILVCYLADKNMNKISGPLGGFGYKGIYPAEFIKRYERAT
jgi:hypothetical protein